MFLYELALEVDRKSGDLVELAAAMEMTGLGPSTELTADQAARLRAAVGERLAPVGGPGSDEVATGPAVWAPPSEQAPAAVPPSGTAPSVQEADPARSGRRLPRVRRWLPSAKSG